MAEIVAMESSWQEKRLHYSLNEQIFGADKQDTGTVGVFRPYATLGLLVRSSMRHFN